MLLTRDQFRNQVFQRDANKCVVCGDKAQGAHHWKYSQQFKNELQV